MSLDELLLLGPRRGLKHICRFAGVYVNRRMKQFFNRRMSSELANAERWRRGLSDRRAAKLERLYVEIIDRFEADGIGCAPLLRAHARAIAGRAGGSRAPARLPGGRRKAGRGEDVSEPADLVFVGGTGRSGTTVISHLLDHHSRFSRRADRVPLPLQPEGPRRRRRRPGDRRAVRPQASDLLVVPDPGRLASALVPAGVVGRARVAPQPRRGAPSPR